MRAVKRANFATYEMLSSARALAQLLHRRKVQPLVMAYLRGPETFEKVDCRALVPRAFRHHLWDAAPNPQLVAPCRYVLHYLSGAMQTNLGQQEMQ